MYLTWGRQISLSHWGLRISVPHFTSSLETLPKYLNSCNCLILLSLLLGSHLWASSELAQYVGLEVCWNKENLLIWERHVPSWHFQILFCCWSSSYIRLKSHSVKKYQNTDLGKEVTPRGFQHPLQSRQEYRSFVP